MSNLNFPLSNAQLELLKVFSTNLSENDLVALKDILSKFYTEKAINKADQIWHAKGLSDESMEKWLNEKS